MARKELHDVTLFFHRETEKAIHVSQDGDEAKAFWLPKSQIEYDLKPNNIVEVTLPTWLASEKKIVGF